MSNLGVLYKYELKKLFKRRIVWVTLIIAFTASALSMILNLCGYAYVDGVKLESNYDAFSALSIDMTPKNNPAKKYGTIKVEALWSGA